MLSAARLWSHALLWRRASRAPLKIFSSRREARLLVKCCSGGSPPTRLSRECHHRNALRAHFSNFRFFTATTPNFRVDSDSESLYKSSGIIPLHYKRTNTNHSLSLSLSHHIWDLTVKAYTVMHKRCRYGCRES